MVREEEDLETSVRRFAEADPAPYAQCKHCPSWVATGISDWRVGGLDVHDTKPRTLIRPHVPDMRDTNF